MCPGRQFVFEVSMNCFHRHIIHYYLYKEFLEKNFIVVVLKQFKKTTASFKGNAFKGTNELTTFYPADMAAASYAAQQGIHFITK